MIGADLEVLHNHLITIEIVCNVKLLDLHCHHLSLLFSRIHHMAQPILFWVHPLYASPVHESILQYALISFSF